MNIDELEGVVHRVLSGKVNLSDAPTLLEYPSTAGQERLFHELMHFIIDEDLRSKDEEYDAMQRKNIMHMLTVLITTTRHS